MEPWPPDVRRRRTRVRPPSAKSRYRDWRNSHSPSSLPPWGSNWRLHSRESSRRRVWPCRFRAWPSSVVRRRRGLRRRAGGSVRIDDRGRRRVDSHGVRLRVHSEKIEERSDALPNGPQDSYSHRVPVDGREPGSNEPTDRGSPRFRFLFPMNEDVEIGSLKRERNKLRGWIGRTGGEEEREFIVGLQLVPSEQEGLKFRCQCRAGNAQPSVGRPERGQWIRRRLSLDQQRAGRQEENEEQQNRSGLHANLAGISTYEVLRALGKQKSAEANCSKSRRDAGRPGLESFKVVTTMSLACVGVQAVSLGPI